MTRKSAIRAGGLLFLAVMVLAASAGQAGAVVVAGTTGNTTAPPDDPGWDHMGKRGASAVYLGYRWVLTAAHVGAGSIELEGEQYYVESGTTHTLKYPDDPSYNSDLLLFRLQENPHLRALSIASSTPALGQQVTMIGKGTNRQEALAYWDADWNEIDPPGPGRYRGFKFGSGGDMRWGTNIIDNSGFSLDYSGYRCMMMKTYFDESGGTDDECQVAGGDSGGGVFHKDGDYWDLVGILTIRWHFTGQPNIVVFGNATGIVDLSYYRDQIMDIITPLPGDASLDGVVNDLDASILAANWQTASGAIWEDGDFNGDGAVNDLDASILAAHWQEGVQEGDFASVPEPATMVLLAGGFLSLVFWRWRRRRAVGG